jgi:hypothetical protein
MKRERVRFGAIVPKSSIGPLGEKPKAVGVKPVQGTWQIGPVTSGEGMPAVWTAGRSDKDGRTVYQKHSSQQARKGLYWG